MKMRENKTMIRSKKSCSSTKTADCLPQNLALQWIMMGDIEHQDPTNDQVARPLILSGSHKDVLQSHPRVSAESNYANIHFPYVSVWYPQPGLIRAFTKVMYRENARLASDATTILSSFFSTIFKNRPLYKGMVGTDVNDHSWGNDGGRKTHAGFCHSAPALDRGSGRSFGRFLLSWSRCNVGRGNGKRWRKVIVPHQPLKRRLLLHLDHRPPDQDPVVAHPRLLLHTGASACLAKAQPAELLAGLQDFFARGGKSANRSANNGSSRVWHDEDALTSGE